MTFNFSSINTSSTSSAGLLDQSYLTNVNTIIGKVLESDGKKPSDSGTWMIGTGSMVIEIPETCDGKKPSGSGTWQEIFSLLGEADLFNTIETQNSVSAPVSTLNDNLVSSTTDDLLTGLGGSVQLLGFTSDGL